MYISQYDNQIALSTVEVIECNSLLMNFITFYYIGIQYHPTYIYLHTLRWEIIKLYTRIRKCRMRLRGKSSINFIHLFSLIIYWIYVLYRYFVHICIDIHLIE